MRRCGNGVSREEGMVRLIVWTCVHHYFVFFGRYGARAQKSRYTNDTSRGSRVLVVGIIMMSTVVEAILLKGTASMHADGIDVVVSAISR